MKKTSKCMELRKVQIKFLSIQLGNWSNSEKNTTIAALKLFQRITSTFRINLKKLSTTNSAVGMIRPKVFRTENTALNMLGKKVLHRMQKSLRNKIYIYSPQSG